MHNKKKLRTRSELITYGIVNPLNKNMTLNIFVSRSCYMLVGEANINTFSSVVATSYLFKKN